MNKYYIILFGLWCILMFFSVGVCNNLGRERDAVLKENIVLKKQNDSMKKTLDSINNPTLNLIEYNVLEQ
jgi:hypothetical protein